jgi:hypothetical protein
MQQKKLNDYIDKEKNLIKFNFTKHKLTVVGN